MYINLSAISFPELADLVANMPQDDIEVVFTHLDDIPRDLYSVFQTRLRSILLNAEYDPHGNNDSYEPDLSDFLAPATMVGKDSTTISVSVDKGPCLITDRSI